MRPATMRRASPDSGEAGIAFSPSRPPGIAADREPRFRGAEAGIARGFARDRSVETRQNPTRIGRRVDGDDEGWKGRRVVAWSRRWRLAHSCVHLRSPVLTMDERRPEDVDSITNIGSQSYVRRNIRSASVGNGLGVPAAPGTGALAEPVTSAGDGTKTRLRQKSCIGRKPFVGSRAPAGGGAPKTGRQRLGRAIGAPLWSGHPALDHHAVASTSKRAAGKAARLVETRG